MSANLNTDECQLLLEEVCSGRLTPLDAMSRFEAWMAATDRALQAAGGELRPAGDEAWDACQLQMRRTLQEMGALLRSCTTMEQFQASLPPLEAKLAELQASAHQLEETLDDEPTEEVHGPLPDQIRGCLDHLQTALSRLVSYAENRQRQELEDLAAEIKLAGQAVQEFLKQND